MMTRKMLAGWVAKTAFDISWRPKAIRPSLHPSLRIIKVEVKNGQQLRSTMEVRTKSYSAIPRSCSVQKQRRSVLDVPLAILNRTELFESVEKRTLSVLVVEKKNMISFDCEERNNISIGVGDKEHVQYCWWRKKHYQF